MPRRPHVSRGLASAIGALSVLLFLAPVLASARSDAKIAGIWSGTWRTETVTLRLTQQGERVTGSFEPGHGTVEGIASGFILKGKWHVPGRKPPEDAGELALGLAENGRSFSGSWRLGSEGEWEDWDGERATALPASAKALAVVLFHKTYKPHSAYVANGARITICNRDDFNHHPMSLNTGNQFDAFLEPGQCTTITARNPTSALRQLKLYDKLHSDERMVIVVAPTRFAKPSKPAPAPITWVLKRTKVNPNAEPTRPGSEVVASSGHLTLQLLDSPQAQFTVSYAAPPERLTPGSRYEFPVETSGEILGGMDTPGYRRIDPILYVNDRWDSTGPIVIQECGDPIGPEPMKCSPRASAKGKLGFAVPTPARRGAAFSFGVGALNCLPCYVRFEYRAK